jgi:methionine synthase II (cobalamin-independent)
MLKTASLGFPRIGANRELKKAVESYWKKTSSLVDLQKAAAEIRAKNWQTQKAAGIAFIPSNDFSFYDQILDIIALFGAVPDRFKFNGGNVDLDLYFAMSRGAQRDGIDVIAMEMTKWFDTNYHFIVAEFKKDQQFKISSTKIFDEYQEAKALGIETRPVVVGPLSFLLLGKTIDGSDKLDLLDNLLVAYVELFKKLQEIGVKDVQIDEPFLVTDLPKGAADAYKKAFTKIKQAAGSIKLHLATYFDSLNDNAALAFELGTASVHVDLVRANEQFAEVLNLVKADQSLSLGLIDGRNIWINNLENSVSIAKKAVEKLGRDRVIVAPSCSLIHTPVDLNSETALDAELKSWLTFATQKLDELAVIAKAADGNESEVKAALDFNKAAIENRKSSKRIHDDAVKQRVSSIDESLMNVPQTHASDTSYPSNSTFDWNIVKKWVDKYETYSKKSGYYLVKEALLEQFKVPGFASCKDQLNEWLKYTNNINGNVLALAFKDSIMSDYAFMVDSIFIKKNIPMFIYVGLGSIVPSNTQLWIYNKVKKNKSSMLLKISANNGGSHTPFLPFSKARIKLFKNIHKYISNIINRKSKNNKTKNNKTKNNKTKNNNTKKTM